jgi:hypothetical protein
MRWPETHNLIERIKAARAALPGGESKVRPTAVSAAVSPSGTAGNNQRRRPLCDM